MPERFMRGIEVVNGIVWGPMGLGLLFGTGLLHRMVRKLPQSKPDGFASSLWEGAFGIAGKFLA